MKMSDKAKGLYDYMVKEYIDKGYMYSGSIGGYDFNHAGLNNWSEIRAAIEELQKLGLIQIRKCDAFAVELTKDIRKQLIIEHKLDESWEEKAPHFYPNSEYGEVRKVFS